MLASAAANNLNITAHTDMLDMYPTLCYIGADTSQMSKKLQLRRSKETGNIYYILEFDVVLLFGLTELKAQIAWQEEVGLSFLLMPST